MVAEIINFKYLKKRLFLLGNQKEKGVGELKVKAFLRDRDHKNENGRTDGLTTRKHNTGGRK